MALTTSCDQSVTRRLDQPQSSQHPALQTRRLQVKVFVTGMNLPWNRGPLPDKAARTATSFSDPVAPDSMAPPRNP